MQLLGSNSTKHSYFGEEAVDDTGGRCRMGARVVMSGQKVWEGVVHVRVTVCASRCSCYVSLLRFSGKQELCTTLGRP